MRLSTVLATLAAFAPAILAAPTDPMETNKTTKIAEPAAPATALATPAVIVKNHCPFPAFVTSVGQGGPQGPTSEIPAYTSWSEPQYWSGIGTALDFTRTREGLYTGASVLVLGYSYTAGVSIYYDIGLHAGNPFAGYNVKLSGAGGDNFWDPEPKPPQTRAYFGQTDLTLDLCP